MFPRIPITRTGFALLLGTTLAACGSVVSPPTPVSLKDADGRCKPASAFPQTEGVPTGILECWRTQLIADQDAERSDLTATIQHNLQAKTPDNNLSLLKTAVGPTGRKALAYADSSVPALSDEIAIDVYQKQRLTFPLREVALEALPTAGLTPAQQLDVLTAAAKAVENQYTNEGIAMPADDVVDSTATVIKTGLKDKTLTPRQAIQSSTEIMTAMNPNNSTRLPQPGGLEHSELLAPVMTPAQVATMSDKDLSLLVDIAPPWTLTPAKPSDESFIYNAIRLRQLPDVQANFLGKVLDDNRTWQPLASYSEGLTPDVIDPIVRRNLTIDPKNTNFLAASSCKALATLPKTQKTDGLSRIEELGCWQQREQAQNATELKQLLTQ
jgi:hypothetical protein